MRRSAKSGQRSDTAPENASKQSLRAKRGAISKWAALLVFGIVIVAASYASHRKFLMPGPLTAAHNLQTDCRSCHSNIPDERMGWLHTVLAFADPKKESRACSTCHKINGEALSPHDLARQELQRRSKRLRSKASSMRPPSLSARFRNALMPAGNRTDDGIFCATCHKEHQGKDFDITRMSDDRCQSCHVVQFRSFAKDHPEFESYPHKRRTRIIFDHSTHFEKHFPEALKGKTTSQSVPRICTDCHSTRGDKRLLGVKPFKLVCASCHIDQIVGRERASGPTGIAFLTLPGLDVETLQKKKIPIGKWPDDSEADITPFMVMLLGLDEDRRKLLRTVSNLDLLDLSEATESELTAVGRFVWELKALLHELTTSKTSAIAKRLSQATGDRVDADLTAKLVATIPRDVLLSAGREWLPQLAKEMATRPLAAAAVWKTSVKARENARDVPPSDASKIKGSLPEKKSVAPKALPPRPFRVEDRSNLLPAGQAAIVGYRERSQKFRLPVQTAQAGTSESSKSWRVDPYGRLIKGDQDPQSSERPEGENRDANADGSVEDSDEAPQSTTDESADQSDAGVSESDQADTTEPAKKSANLAIDAESWAEFGGWYRKDYAILYKPTGHADVFLRAWLEFSGRLQDGSENSLAAPVFDLLTHKDAQGQCSKCHGIDKTNDHSLIIEWGTSTLAEKSGKLTSFLHEPHFGILDDRGCLSCHKIDAAAKYQSSYKQRDPKKFVSNFKPMKKKQCTTCHKKKAARQDCKLCHTYHVNDVTSPVAKTKVPKNSR